MVNLVLQAAAQRLSLYHRNHIHTLEANNMLPSTADRVRDNSADEVNKQIDMQTVRNVARYAHARSYEVDRRLAELDAEWDIERYLETMAPSFTLLGMFLGLTKSRKWFAIPIVVQGFFLQHASQGWCPPLILLHRLGIRTADEINKERYALKAVRGDFDDVDARNAMAAVEG
jgi:hypothetical protein